MIFATNKVVLNFEAKMGKFNQQMQFTQNRLQRFREGMQRFGGVMALPVKRLKTASNSINRLGTRSERAAKGIRTLTHGMRGFRMEALGVMFFGMMLQRTFMGLLNPVLETFGVFDLFRMMLLVLFIPIMQVIFPLLLKFVTYMMNLSHNTKMIIGVITLLGIAFGAALFIIGTFLLGIGSLILLFKGLFGWIGLVVGGLFGIAAITLLVDLFKKLGNNVDETKAKVVSFGVSAEVFDDVAEAIVNMFTKMKEGTDEHLPTFKEKFKNIFKDLMVEISDMSEEWTAVAKKLFGYLSDGFQDFLKENPAIIIGAIIGAWFGGPAGLAIGAAIGGMFENLDLEKMDEITNTGIGILDGILDGFEQNEEKIAETMINFIKALGTWIGENSGRLIKLGLKIGAAILSGISQGILSGLDAVLSKIPGFGEGGAVRNFVESIGPHSKSVGGRIPETGLYRMHRGEEVIPAQRTNDSVGGSMIITNNFSGFTMEELKRELDDRDRRMVNAIERNR